VTDHIQWSTLLTCSKILHTHSASASRGLTLNDVISRQVEHRLTACCISQTHTQLPTSVPNSPPGCISHSTKHSAVTPLDVHIILNTTLEQWGKGVLSIVRGSIDVYLCNIVTILQELTGYGALQASSGYGGRGVTMATHFDLASNVRMSGVTSTFTHTPLWRE
jgi:hypothetical protein